MTHDNKTRNTISNSNEENPTSTITEHCRAAQQRAEGPQAQQHRAPPGNLSSTCSPQGTKPHYPCAQGAGAGWTTQTRESPTRAKEPVEKLAVHPVPWQPKLALGMKMVVLPTISSPDTHWTGSQFAPGGWLTLSSPTHGNKMVTKALMEDGSSLLSQHRLPNVP